MGDIDEALNAASQLGDDTLQRKNGGTVQPETWTDGSSAERKARFRKGYTQGAAGCGISPLLRPARAVSTAPAAPQR